MYENTRQACTVVFNIKRKEKINKITNNISYNKHCCAISYTCVNKEGDSKKNAKKTIKVLLVF